MSVGSRTHRRRPWRRGAFFIGIGLTLLLGLALGPVAAPGVAAGSATDADTLREQVADDGWVRVRVELRTDAAAAPAAPLAMARTAAAPAAGADTRAQTVDDLLFALPDGSYRGLAYSAGAGSLTLSVDPAGLDGLLASPLVATVATAGVGEMQRIAAGGWYGDTSGQSLAINPDGSLWAWGSNQHGELGDGTNTQRSIPVQVLTGVRAVADGAYHTLAIRTNGTLWAWGRNAKGQLGDGTTTDRRSPVQVLTGVAAIAAGEAHSLALKTDGSLWAWGSNESGQIGDGSINSRSSPVQVLVGVAAVAAGGWHSLAIKTDGSLWAWGHNGFGQLGDGATAFRSRPVRIVTGVAAVAAGSAHSLAIKTDGTLWAWGSNTSGQIGEGTVANRLRPVQVLTGVATVAGGGLNSLAIKTDRGLWAWGSNQFGQLGDGTTTNRPRPVQVLTGVAGVAGGSRHTLAIKTDGSLWAWGRNLEGQLGDGTTSNRSTPVQVRLPGPDFAITRIALTPVGPITNRTFSAAVTVRNLGTGAGAPRAVRLWPNRTTAAACGATGGSSVNLPSLAAGASTTVTLSGLAAGTAAGNRTLRAFVDPACLTGETNETNNQFSLAYRVGPPVPDFVVTAATLTPSGPVANRTFDATLTVRNQGAAAGVPGSLRVWANRVSAPVCGTAADKSAALTASLAPGASTSVTVRGLAAGTTGAKTLRAFIEAECKATESDETNNQFSRGYQVFAQALPDFAVTALVPTPASPRAGAAFSVAVTVRNLGAGAGDGGFLDLWAQDPGARACGAHGHAYARVGTLAAGASRTLTVAALPAGAAGAAALRAFVDSACATAEADDGNNQTVQGYTVAP